MDKLKKIGLTALATSLVASSGYAAEVTIAGAAGFTWSSQSGDTGTPDTDHGKGIGVDNSMTFNMSGELDNGWSVSAYTAMNDSHALTSSAVTLTMGDMGKIQSGNGYGGHSASYDEETPRAYEQVDDGGGTATSMNQVGSKNDNGGINYTAPTIDAGGATVTIHLGYVPKAEDAFSAGGGTTGVSTIGSGSDAGITIAHESGLTLGVYAAQRTRYQSNENDAFEGTWYATYNMGPVAFGYQQSYADSGTSPSQVNAAATATFDTASGYFEATQYAIAFNVNDDLSISWQKAEDTYDAQAGSSAGSTTGDAVADVAVDTKSISAAYSMGSMSIKAYRTTTDNVGYNTGSGSLTVNEIALGLSF